MPRPVLPLAIPLLLAVHLLWPLLQTLLLPAPQLAVLQPVALRPAVLHLGISVPLVVSLLLFAVPQQVPLPLAIPPLLAVHLLQPLLQALLLPAPRLAVLHLGILFPLLVSPLLSAGPPQVPLPLVLMPRPVLPLAIPLLLAVHLLWPPLRALLLPAPRLAVLQPVAPRLVVLHLRISSPLLVSLLSVPRPAQPLLRPARQLPVPLPPVLMPRLEFLLEALLALAVHLLWPHLQALRVPAPPLAVLQAVALQPAVLHLGISLPLLVSPLLPAVPLQEPFPPALMLRLEFLLGSLPLLALLWPPPQALLLPAPRLAVLQPVVLQPAVLHLGISLLLLVSLLLVPRPAYPLLQPTRQLQLKLLHPVRLRLCLSQTMPLLQVRPVAHLQEHPLGLLHVREHPVGGIHS